MDHDYPYVLRNFWTPLLAFSLLVGVYLVWLGMALSWLAAKAKQCRIRSRAEGDMRTDRAIAGGGASS